LINPFQASSSRVSVSRAGRVSEGFLRGIPDTRRQVNE
jgi:hypothetical protein